MQFVLINLTNPQLGIDWPSKEREKENGMHQISTHFDSHVSSKEATTWGWCIYHTRIVYKTDTSTIASSIVNLILINIDLSISF